jgi:two-component system, NtrC family, sensor histidine kinase PilS
MAPIDSDARMLIAVRVVVVTTLLLGSLIIQFTVKQLLPINYIYTAAGLTYGMTLCYIVMGVLIRNRTLNLSVQIGGDLIVETLLVYFTGGLDSPFSFLYLVSIITASTLLYRQGGLFTASGSVILYGALGDLMYYGVIREPEQTWFVPTPWNSSRLYLNMATNFAGFYATALLTSYVSEKLRKTREELAVKQKSFAELQALNENVVESIPSGLITTSPEGVASFVNPAACEIMSTTAGSVLGRDMVELGFFSAEEWDQLRLQLHTEPVVRGEKDGFAVGEGYRSVGYAVTPLNTLDGKAYGYTLIFQDLTEMKKLEAQVRLKDRMAAVGELSAGIAHEIRNPLAAIAGSVQVLKNSTALSPQEQRLMSIILKESDRLNKSIAEFLRFVRPQETNRAGFDIASSLNETLDLLTNSPELTADHEIHRSIVPPAFMAVGDPDQIRQVFWNLARNAIQAMPKGGILTVTTTIEDGLYRIHFIDSGRGMSEADQRRLFQPFRTNFPSGTGLGMAISYRIVQAHQGRIDVRSLEGAGSTITVSLPIPETVTPSSELPASTASRA